MYVLVDALVFLGHLVDVLLRKMPGHLIDHFPLNHDKVVWIVLVGDRKRHMWILLDVALFRSAKGGVDQYELPVSIDPCRGDLRHPVRVNRRYVDEVLPFEQLPRILSQTYHFWSIDRPRLPVLIGFHVKLDQLASTLFTSRFEGIPRSCAGSYATL